MPVTQCMARNNTGQFDLVPGEQIPGELLWWGVRGEESSMRFGGQLVFKDLSTASRVESVLGPEI